MARKYPYLDVSRNAGDVCISLWRQDEKGGYCDCEIRLTPGEARLLAKKIDAEAHRSQKFRLITRPKAGEGQA